KPPPNGAGFIAYLVSQAGNFFATTLTMLFISNFFLFIHKINLLINNLNFELTQKRLKKNMPPNYI
ncbi:MAG: hypothetical protein CO133_02740, partial [Candidatus Komeilibacteria bacterium CG_4_9_14_3_um_filter_37_5]